LNAREQRQKTASRPPDISRAGLERSALAYLDRFDCSVEKLRRFLQERVRKAERVGVSVPDGTNAVIDALLERYQASGILNDERFAKNYTERLRARGGSQRLIEQKLRVKSLSASSIQTALAETKSRDSELEAARALVRRRRLGPHRQPEERAQFRRKDLATLARAGFDYDTAAKALGDSGSDEDF
jgi:regulatory protein